MNLHSDEVATENGSSMSPSELGFFRLGLAKVIASGTLATRRALEDDEEEEESSSSSSSAPLPFGSDGSLSRSAFLSLRTDLVSDLKSLSLPDAERALSKFVAGGWLDEVSEGKVPTIRIGARTYAEVGTILESMGLKNLPQKITLR